MSGIEGEKGNRAAERSGISENEVISWIQGGNWCDLEADGRVIGEEAAVREVMEKTPDGKAIGEIVRTAIRSKRRRQERARLLAEQNSGQNPEQRKPTPVVRPVSGGPLVSEYSPAWAVKEEADAKYDIKVINEFDHEVMFCDYHGIGVNIPANSRQIFKDVRFCDIWDWTTNVYVGIAEAYQGLDYIRVGPSTFELQPNPEEEEPGEIVMFTVKNYMNTLLELVSWDDNGNQSVFNALQPNTEGRFRCFRRGQSLALMTKDGTLVRECFVGPDTGKEEGTLAIVPQYRTYSGVEVQLCDSSLFAPAIGAYQIGTADFTVLATAKPTGTGVGVLTSFAGAANDTDGESGFILKLENRKKIRFATMSGTATLAAVTKDPADALYDGMEHCVAGVRSGSQLQIFLDGEELPTVIEGSGVPPLDVGADHPFEVGAAYSPMFGKYAGKVYNVGFWRKKLTPEEMMQASFEIDAPSLKEEMLGYWKLDYTYNDVSQNENAMTPQGDIAFVSDCSLRWKYGEKKYFYLRCGNTQNDTLPSVQRIDQKLSFELEEGTPALYITLYDNGAYFNEQPRVEMLLCGPDGKFYTASADTDDLYVVLGENGLEKVVIQKPMKGTWTLFINASPKVPFSAQVNTLPDIDDADEIERIMTETVKSLHTPRDAADDEAILNEAFGGIGSMLADIEIEEDPEGVNGFLFRRGRSPFQLLIALIRANPITAAIVISVVVVVTAMVVTAAVKEVKKKKAQAIVRLKKAALYLDGGGNPKYPDQFIDWLAVSKNRAQMKSYIAQRLTNSQELSGSADDVTTVAPLLRSTSYEVISASGKGCLTSVASYDPKNAIMEYTMWDLNKIAKDKIFFLYASQACANEFSVGFKLASKGAKAVFGFENILYPIRDKSRSDNYLGEALFTAEKEFLCGAKAKDAVLTAKAKFTAAKAEYLKNYPDDELFAAIIEYTGNNLVGPGNGGNYGDPNCKIN